MLRSVLFMLILLSINSSVYAGDNSQATLGDIKEAVYKLIVKNKESSIRVDSLETKLQTVKLSSDDIYAHKKSDKLDEYIGKFVVSNRDTLDQIKREK